jgi:flagellar biosynthesis protein FlhF
MQIKVFHCDTMAEALRRVKETFGPDALILSTKTVRKGKWGIFGRPVLEVTAAAEHPSKQEEERDPTERKRSERSTDFSRLLDTPQESGSSGNQRRKEPDFEHQKRELLDMLHRDEGEEAEQQRSEQSRAAGGDGWQEMRGDMQELQLLLREVKRSIRNGDGRFPVRPERGDRTEPDGRTGSVSAGAHLARLGVDPEIAQRVSASMQDQGLGERLSDPESARQSFLDNLGSWLGVKGVDPEDETPQRIALVGPTGVGKTTTIAKIAANALRNGSRGLVLVTIDHYRIGAMEQLKAYADIMKVPFETVSEPEEMADVVKRHADKGLMLIDTAGCSPKDEISMQELKSFFPHGLNIEKHMVLSATTRHRDLQNIVRRFSVIEPQSLIFTKLDESDDNGCLFNIPYWSGLPISFLANGQKVPEDLVSPSLGAVAGFMEEQVQEQGASCAAATA